MSGRGGPKAFFGTQRRLAHRAVFDLILCGRMVDIMPHSMPNRSFNSLPHRMSDSMRYSMANGMLLIVCLTPWLGSDGLGRDYLGPCGPESSAPHGNWPIDCSLPVASSYRNCPKQCRQCMRAFVRACVQSVGAVGACGRCMRSVGRSVRPSVRPSVRRPVRLSVR